MTMYVPRYKKTYLSRAMTRAMALEHPIGDPYGGAAYGERNEPVSAILAIGTMMGTYAAAGTFAAMTLAQGLMFAGAALSLVGNVSGNKTLSRVGMVVGIAGGVGSLFDIGTSATLGETFGFGGGEGAAQGISSATGSAAQLGQTPNVAAEALPVQNAAPSVVDAGTAAAGPAAASVGPAEIVTSSGVNLSNTPTSFDAFGSPVAAGSPAAMNAVDPALLQSPASAASAVAAPTVSAPTVGAPAGPSVPQAGMSFDSFGNPAPAGSAAAMSADPTGLAQMQVDANAAAAKPKGFFDNLKAGNVMDAAKSAGSSMMDLTKTNPGAAYMLGSAASGAIDWASGKTEAQINEMEARGELSKAQADKLRYEVELAKKRRENLNRNYANVQNPLANWRPTFQVVPPGQAPGLISGAMTPAPAPTPGG